LAGHFFAGPVPTAHCPAVLGIAGSVVIPLMTRYMRFLCFVVAAGFAATPSFAQSRDAEAARVYSAAFDFLFGQYKSESPRTIVLFDSTSWDAANVAYKGVIQQSHSSAVDPETIRDF